MRAVREARAAQEAPAARAAQEAREDATTRWAIGVRHRAVEPPAVSEESRAEAARAEAMAADTARAAAVTAEAARAATARAAAERERRLLTPLEAIHRRQGPPAHSLEGMKTNCWQRLGLEWRIFDEMYKNAKSKELKQVLYCSVKSDCRIPLLPTFARSQLKDRATLVARAGLKLRQELTQAVREQTCVQEMRRLCDRNLKVSWECFVHMYNEADTTEMRKVLWFNVQHDRSTVGPPSL